MAFQSPTKREGSVAPCCLAKSFNLDQTPAMFDLTGKVALISGAAQGMGRAMAQALAEAGAHTLLVDRNEVGLRDTAATIEKLGRRAVMAKCDVANPVQIRDLFRRFDEEFGQIDFLGNVAGEG